ncbi:MAG: hypothetical protein J6Q79_09170 [Clostridia bacterium]|nr:hypothetical protein [Clostridia bacterium]
MKKLVSLLLVLIMTLSFAVSAWAADDTLSSSELSAAVDAAATAMVAADDDASVTPNAALYAAVAAEADTPEEVANFFSGFVFVKDSEIEAVSQRIADSCEYNVVVIEDGKKTVYIAVNLIKNREIFDARVFLNTTEKLLKKAEELAISDGMNQNPDSYDLMSYHHLAGELALHMILADVTNDLGATKGNSILRKLYNMSVVSDLNVDENRIGPALIEFFGHTIVFFLNTFYKTFSNL